MNAAIIIFESTLHKCKVSSATYLERCWKKSSESPYTVCRRDSFYLTTTYCFSFKKGPGGGNSVLTGPVVSVIALLVCVISDWYYIYIYGNTIIICWTACYWCIDIENLCRYSWHNTLGLSAGNSETQCNSMYIVSDTCIIFRITTSNRSNKCNSFCTARFVSMPPAAVFPKKKPRRTVHDCIWPVRADVSKPAV